MRIPKKSKMRGLIRLPIDNADVLIYSNLDSDRGHSRSEGRERITVWASFDGAKSWPVKRLVYDGPSAYSTLAAGRKGTITEGMIYLTFEGGPRGQHADVLFARFNLAWLMDGELTGDGIVPAVARRTETGPRLPASSFLLPANKP